MTDQTKNPSEAAASSPSPYLSEGMLRAQANPDCAFPDAVQVLSREILRMRRDCPPTAEVEQMRAELTSLRHAVGLMTTAKPDMEVDVRDPVGMAQKVVAMVEELRRDGLTALTSAIEQKKRADLAELDRDAWKHKADSLGADLNRIRALVPTTSDEQTTFDAVFTRLQNLRAENEKQSYALRENGELHLHLHNIDEALREAGRPHRHKGDELERIRDLAGEVRGLRGGEILGAVVAIDMFLSRCGIKTDRLAGLLPVQWVIEAAKLLKTPVVIHGGELSLPAEAQTAIAAMRDVGPELAKAGVPVGPRCSHAEAVAQLHGERDRWREKFEAVDREAAEAARWGINTIKLLADAGFLPRAPKEAGVHEAVVAALAELDRLRKESKRDRAEKQQALLDEIARLFPGKGDLLGRVQKGAALAKIGADANNDGWRERFMRLRDSIKVQLAWCSTPSGTPHPAMLAEHRVLSCALKNAEAMLREASGDLASLPSLPAKEGPLPGSFCGTNQPEMPPLKADAPCGYKPASHRDDFDDTPNFVGKVASVPVELSVDDVAKAARKGVADMLVAAGEAALASIQSQQEHVAPATGQPRTEAPLAADGSGTVVELGEAFRVAMRESGTADHEGQRLRWLRDAVAELAKVVERIGAR